MAKQADFRFPQEFLWGASTASYQVEGGNEGSALWDWEVKKGWERSGEAAGSWELFEQDLACLKSLNLNSYRFSVEWSRVEPEPGRFNEQALARYAQWAARLKEEGLRPVVCFHHFSEPAWLFREHPKGWLDPALKRRFLAFVEKTAEALKDSVKDWIVFNEPMVFLVGGYGMGHFPPGRWMLANVQKEFNPILVKNLCRAHNEAYDILHLLQPEANVGVAHHISALEPARAGDEKAVADWDWFMHRQFLDLTKDRLDFLGINYYTRIFVHKSRLPFLPMGVVPGYAEFEQGVTPLLFRLLGGRRGERPRTGMNWEVYPEGLKDVLLKFWSEYRLPLCVTENGMAAAPGVDREDFIRTHLAAMAQAIEAGADIRGYFHWSLMDNYEWGSYKPKFGLFSRDRRPSQGSAYYAQAAKAGAITR